MLTYSHGQRIIDIITPPSNCTGNRFQPGFGVDWAAHKNYPELLEGKILSKISTAKRRAVSLSDQKLIRSCQSATNAIKLLAELMRSSSSVRVLADYERR